jgi:soluble lytic murein transglycosylase-like protein
VVIAALFGTGIWSRSIAMSTQPSPVTVQRSEREVRLALSPVFTPEVMAWSREILRWAENSPLDPNLIATVMQIESCGDSRAVSSSGALGLFQVMPFHFTRGEDPFDIETNSRRGLDYLARSLGLAGGRTDLALAGYNAGHGVIAEPAETWPTETRRYVDWGSGILAESRLGIAASPTLTMWLAAGGERLCKAAQGFGRASPQGGTLPG